MLLTELLNLSEADIAFLGEEDVPIEIFYDELEAAKFIANTTFEVKIPFKINNMKVGLEIPVTLDMQNLKAEKEQYVSATPEFKKKLDVYAYWYDNFNKLIYGSMSESDASLFLAACAFTSANTALDQNILEAAKLFDAAKHDFDMTNGKVILHDIATHVSDNMDNEELTYLKKYQGAGSAYANLLTPKKDYKGLSVKAGARKGQEDVFSEITVSNAKIPNFNKFILYYLDNNGKIDRKQLFEDFKSGKFEIGGTKISSFFLNLIFPGTKWDKNIDPATIDRWMIRVFFDKPLAEMAENYIDKWIEKQAEKTGIKVGKKDTPAIIAKKKIDAINKHKDAVINAAVMQLFGNDRVRQSLVKILNDAAKELGLTAYQLQALAWVNIRIRYKEPAAKFAKFEDVMDYAEDAAKGVMELDPNINKVLNTIKTLASGPRFKFKNRQDVVNTILNRKNYEHVYYLPPKNDVEAKKALKIAMKSEQWGRIRVAYKGDKTAEIFDLNKSNKNPVQKIQGTSPKDVLDKTYDWIAAYNPEMQKPKVKKPASAPVTK